MEEQKTEHTQRKLNQDKMNGKRKIRQKEKKWNQQRE